MFRVSVGTSALSLFRMEKLCATVKTRIPQVSVADTRHCYFTASHSKELSSSQARLLDKVLGLDKTAGEPKDASQYQQLLVVPRLGTISPWSSKATDIARHCGLSGVQRIERGVIYYLHTAHEKPLSKAEHAVLLPLLHDRMTESVLHALDSAAQKIFQHGVPQPLTSVDILQGGSGSTCSR